MSDNRVELLQDIAHRLRIHSIEATTAAMQLAKPLGKNPRQVAEALRESLLKTAVYSHWVEAIDIAGPGFMNIKLKPAAKQEVLREILSTQNAFGNQAPTASAISCVKLR